MDKKTLIAVVLCSIVMAGGMYMSYQQAPEALPEPAVAEVTTPVESVPAQPSLLQDESYQIPVFNTSTNLTKKNLVIETNLVIAEFTNEGGEMVSYRLKEHLEDGEPLELVFKGDSGINGFAVQMGGADGASLDALFEVQQKDPYTIEFSQKFGAQNGVPFILRKEYSFYPDEYLFDLKITVENTEKEYLALDYDGFSYTLNGLPQIGPKFEAVDGRYTYRRMNYLLDGDFERFNRKQEFSETIDTRVSWVSMAGRYFAMVAIPGSVQYQIHADQNPIEGLPLASQMQFSRPSVKAAKQEDLFRFYMGPKLEQYLTRYDKKDSNTLGIADLNLGPVQDQSSWFGFLENFLKILLNMFYQLIPNYGVAIILLTILIKVVLFPITKKSYQSTSKMQALGPKMNAIKEKYKDNPQKMNAEIAELYRKEGVNPMGGCLPLLLQMPIFFALYGLLIKHFELRGAPFMLWMNDLSVGDSIYHFANFKVPLLGWTDIRLLPVLFVATQIISSKMMQTPDNSNKQMQNMMLIMPLVFFFILYNAPSGLLLYWIATNVLTTIQQKAIAKHMKSKDGKPSEKNIKKRKK